MDIRTASKQQVFDEVVRGLMGLRSRPDLLPLLHDIQVLHDRHQKLYPGDTYRFRDALTQVARKHYLSQAAVFDNVPSAKAPSPSYSYATR